MKEILQWIIFLTIGRVISSSVIELTPDNIDHHMTDNRFRFVLFYSPWQQECNDKIKMVEEVARMIKGDHMIGKVDVYARKKLAYRYHVESFCEFRYFLKGSMVSERYKISQIILFLRQLVDECFDIYINKYGYNLTYFDTTIFTILSFCLLQYLNLFAYLEVNSNCSGGSM